MRKSGSIPREACLMLGAFCLRQNAQRAACQTLSGPLPQSGSPAREARGAVTMRAWPVARSIFDAPYVREANERTTSWISGAAAGRNVRQRAALRAAGCRQRLATRSRNVSSQATKRRIVPWAFSLRDRPLN